MSPSELCRRRTSNVGELGHLGEIVGHVANKATGPDEDVLEGGLGPGNWRGPHVEIKWR